MAEEEAKKTAAAGEEQWKAAGNEESGEGWIELPDEADFWKPPARFGSLPVEKEPLGWDKRQGFRKHFPRLSLPFQVVERVPFGHPDLNPNRLFWGDNLGVMRSLAGESVDLIYLDPPFFSQREYSIVWGETGERRSFSDIWKEGLPSYLTWLNARLAEAKRLLKLTGSLYLHCDWHAGHYIKVELDKIFGYHNFRNEIIWHYQAGIKTKRYFGRKHDFIFCYGKSNQSTLTQRDKRRKTKFNQQRKPSLRPEHYKLVEPETGRRYQINGQGNKYYLDEGQTCDDVWTFCHEKQFTQIASRSKERIGYATQKPEALLERIILASSDAGDVVADFFCGGGTTPAVAQRLNRRWLACDQSRVAVSVTRDRLIAQAEQMRMNEQTGKVSPVPDFTMENWGVYEAKAFSRMPPEPFRAFVLKCFGARAESKDGIHGWKGPVPVWVGSPKTKRASGRGASEGFCQRHSQDGPIQANQFAGRDYAGLGIQSGCQTSGGAIAQSGESGFSLYSIGYGAH